MFVLAATERPRLVAAGALRPAPGADSLTAGLTEALKGGTCEFVGSAALVGGWGSAAESVGGTLQVAAERPGQAVDIAVAEVRRGLGALGLTDRGVAEIAVTPGGVDPRLLP